MNEVYIPYEGNHTRGIGNTFSNCWLNTTLQVLCGSYLSVLLPADDDKASNSLAHLLAVVSKELRMQTISPVCVGKLIKDIWHLLLVDPDKNEHVDVGDAFRRVLGQLEHEKAYEEDESAMSFKIANFFYCGKCKNVSGEVNIEHTYVIQVLEITDD